MSNDSLIVTAVGCFTLAALLKLMTLSKWSKGLRVILAALVVGSALGILCGLWEAGVLR